MASQKGRFPHLRNGVARGPHLVTQPPQISRLAKHAQQLLPLLASCCCTEGKSNFLGVLSLCLSRACLGKRMSLSITWRKNGGFLHRQSGRRIPYRQSGRRLPPPRSRRRPLRPVRQQRVSLSLSCSRFPCVCLSQAVLVKITSAFFFTIKSGRKYSFPT